MQIAQAAERTWPSLVTVQQHDDVDIADIAIGDRFRKELGDIAGLADSIKEQGLLQPIGVTDRNELVFGERRLRAFQSLGWSRIPVRRVSVTSIVEGEFAENDIRKDFTPSERVAIAEAVAREIGSRQGQRTDIRASQLPQNLGEVRGRETAAIAAKKAGFGNPETYRQAKSVVVAAVPELVQAMDAGRVSISAAASAKDLQRETIIAALENEDPKKALRDAVITAATTPTKLRPSDRNPLYQPNEQFRVMASVSGCCDTISTHIETNGTAFLIEGILDDGMRSREAAIIRRCMENLQKLMEELRD